MDRQLIVKLFADGVRSGKYTIEDIEECYREEVIAELNKQE